MEKPAIYIPSLDGLRAIAFLLVFVAHSMPDRDLPGGFGVTVFFFLSGYLITTLLRNEAQHHQSINLKSFYLRRLLRIFPACYVTVAIVSSLAALGLLYNTESYKSLLAAFLYFSNCWNILGFGNLPAGMGVLWSLAVEEHYYLLFPPLYAWFVLASVSRKRQAAWLLALCAGALVWRCCRATLFHSPWANIYEGTDTRFDSILYGCVLAIVANPRLGDRVPWFRKHANGLAVAGALLIALSFAYRNPFFRDTFRYTLNAVGLAPIFFLASLPERRFLTRWLEWPVLRWLGQLSYSMYLIHHTLFYHFYHFYRPSFLLAMGILAGTVVYAQAMRSLIELPLQRVRSRLVAKARTASPKPVSSTGPLPGSAVPGSEAPAEARKPAA
ncbi:MAG: acyltransferase family protein [Candidatus Sulfotelmatobacter sp.]